MNFTLFSKEIFRKLPRHASRSRGRVAYLNENIIYGIMPGCYYGIQKATKKKPRFPKVSNLQWEPYGVVVDRSKYRPSSTWNR